jgi:hypothetical protein
VARLVLSQASLGDRVKDKRDGERHYYQGNLNGG